MEQKYTIKDRAFWQIVISLGAASFFIFAVLFCMQPILPILTKDYQIPVSIASLSMSLTTIGLIFGLITIGFLSDRKGRTSFIYLSIISSAILLLIIPFMQAFILIVIFRFFQGFTLAGLLATALAYMAEEIDPKYFGFAATLYIATNAIGGMMGRFVTGYLAEALSWQTALLILGAFGIFTLVFTFFTLPKSKHFTKSNRKFKVDMIGFIVHLKNPSLLLMFGLGFVLQTSFTGLWTYLPFHLLAEPYKLSLQQISYFYFAYSVGTISAPVAGWLSNKFQLSNIRVTGVAFLALGMLFTIGQPLFAIIVGLGIMCLGFFISHSIATATVAQEATHHKGSASSLYLVSYYLGVASGTTLLAPVWENFGWNGIVLFTALLPVVYVVIVKIMQFQIKRRVES